MLDELPCTPSVPAYAEQICGDTGAPLLVPWMWATLTALGLVWGTYLARARWNHGDRWFGHVLRAGAAGLACLAACSQVQAQPTYASLWYVVWNVVALLCCVPLAADVRAARQILDPTWLPDPVERRLMRELFGAQPLGRMFIREYEVARAWWNMRRAGHGHGCPCPSC